MPGHRYPTKYRLTYNAWVEVTQREDPEGLLALPLLGVILLLVLHALENTPKSIRIPNFYLQSRHMLNQIKNVCLMILAFVMTTSVATTLGWWHGLGGWFLPILLIGVCLPIVIGWMRRQRIA